MVHPLKHPLWSLVSQCPVARLWATWLTGQIYWLKHGFRIWLTKEIKGNLLPRPSCWSCRGWSCRRRCCSPASCWRCWSSAPPPASPRRRPCIHEETVRVAILRMELWYSLPVNPEVSARADYFDTFLQEKWMSPLRMDWETFRDHVHFTLGKKKLSSTWRFTQPQIYCLLPRVLFQHLLVELIAVKFDEFPFYS